MDKKNQKNQKNQKRRLYEIAVALCGTAIVLMVTVMTVFTAKSAVREWREKQKETYYLTKERELEGKVRDYLEDNGFRHSGVMLTRIVDEDGNRAYTLTVHHDRIDRMDEERREALSQKLAELCFRDEKCTFRSDFLLPRVCKN